MQLLNQFFDLWELLQQFRGVVILLSPILIPQISRIYTSWKNRTNGRPRERKQLSLKTILIIGVLLLTAFGQILLAGGAITDGPGRARSRIVFGLKNHWISKNVLEFTGSRMQTAGDIIMTRYKQTFAKGREIDPNEQLLLDRLSNLDGRLLYAMYGQDSFLNCEWCSLELPSSFFIYNVPAILFPYVLNYASVIICTHSSVRDARQWRFLAVIILMLMAIVDLGGVFAFPMIRNKDAKPALVDWFYWRKLQTRALYLLAFNVILATLIFLSCMGWLYSTQTPVLIRTDRLRKQLDTSLHKIRSSALLRSVVGSNELYAGEYNKFWHLQNKIDHEVLENSSVKVAIDNAKKDGRLNLNIVSANAAKFVRDYL